MMAGQDIWLQAIRTVFLCLFGVHYMTRGPIKEHFSLVSSVVLSFET